jgi:hypothetical protein
MRRHRGPRSRAEFEPFARSRHFAYELVLRADREPQSRRISPKGERSRRTSRPMSPSRRRAGFSRHCPRMAANGRTGRSKELLIGANSRRAAFAKRREELIARTSLAVLSVRSCCATCQASPTMRQSDCIRNLHSAAECGRRTLSPTPRLGAEVVGRHSGMIEDRLSVAIQLIIVTHGVTGLAQSTQKQRLPLLYGRGADPRR